jgi:hypothetical protein
MEEMVRRVKWRCDCRGWTSSIGAMKTLCRAAAVLNAYLDLFIVPVPFR